MTDKQNWLYSDSDGGFCWYWFIGSSKQFQEDSKFYYEQDNCFLKDSKNVSNFR